LCTEQLVQGGGCVPRGAGRGWAHLLDVVSKAELSFRQADAEGSSHPPSCYTYCSEHHLGLLWRRPACSCS